ncbi:steroid 5 alpha-reductase 1 [Phyllostomus discolor]|uniref:Steroid 5 alpha-reductase 1 n=1 Tax=Phyllostomus discolor TaxID=89673 RepID=A0A834BCN0_9CHIR|nr:steroid 5 alpha-reductase 1 [Phyllostomus discolor]
MELAEPSLLDALSYLECALGILIFVLLKLVGSPYGRYASQHSAWRLAAPTAWALQELPSLAVPLFLCAGTPAERLRWWPNRILLAMFIVHYVQRFCPVGSRHADQHSLRPHPKESQAARGDWIQNSKGRLI